MSIETMRFWWLSVLGWQVALFVWFNELTVLALARTETSYADWKVLTLIFIWLTIVFSFFHAVFTPPVAIQKRFLRSEATEQETDRVSQVKYCETCHILKPERTHHCRVCKRCIPRMDHHCPILQMCVHHHNHKFYILFLVWPAILGLYAFYLCFPCFYRATYHYWTTGEDVSFEGQFVVSAVINALTVLASVVYLLRTQLPNMMRNRTIIEESIFEEADKKEELADYTINGDWKENVSSVMGPMWSWLIPTDTLTGNGNHYNYNLKRASEMR